MRRCKKLDFDRLVDKLQQCGKIDNLQQVCGVFDCVAFVKFALRNSFNRDLDRVSLNTLTELV